MRTEYLSVGPHRTFFLRELIADLRAVRPVPRTSKITMLVTTRAGIEYDSSHRGEAFRQMLRVFVIVHEALRGFFERDVVPRRRELRPDAFRLRAFFYGCAPA